MKKKFIRIISPITLTVIIALDFAIIAFAVFSIQKLIRLPEIYSIIFAVCELFAIVMSVLVTKDVINQGIKLRDDELEFTHLDTDNIFKYNEIVSVEAVKDKKASLVKNFNDRQSKIILHMTDDRAAEIVIGLTSDKTLKSVEEEINAHIGK